VNQQGAQKRTARQRSDHAAAHRLDATPRATFARQIPRGCYNRPLSHRTFPGMHPDSASPPLLQPHASLGWAGDDTPYSDQFHDVYFSRDDGLAESEHVFLQQNRLAERWQALSPGRDSVFVIGETGFGSGLNFILAWRLFLRRAPASARLIFRSLEAFPMSRESLTRALARWPELAPEAAALAEAWPPPVRGLHTLEFNQGRISLQLYLGDVVDALDAMLAADDPGLQARASARVDAWFLDGFAPARNPAMWTEAVLARVAALSREGATLATFTVAGEVRRALERAGFALGKCPGYGTKREMLRGELLDRVNPRWEPRQRETPWHFAAVAAGPARHAIVIGAGIAGCATAASLARRGWRVRVLDSADGPAGAGSGNPQAALFAQLPARDTPHGEFALHAYLYATRFYPALLAGITAAMSRCGLLQLYGPEDAKALKTLSDRYADARELVRFVDAGEASRICGQRVAFPGLYLPASGWISPRAACARLLEHARIETRFSVHAVELARRADEWQVRSAGGEIFGAPNVVLANAHGATALLTDLALPLERLRGQITQLAASSLPGGLRCVVCGDGYVTPAHAGALCCGASFVRGDDDMRERESEHRDNIARVAALFPDFDASMPDGIVVGGRVGQRCASADRAPLLGPVPDETAFRYRYAALARNAREYIAREGAFLPGLYLNIAHGSRGMVSAPLAAEALAAAMNSEPSPLPRRLQRALAPARFLMRRIGRGK